MSLPGDDVQEPARDPQLLELLGWAGRSLYWIGWGIAVTIYYAAYYLSIAVVFILKLLYRPLEFVLLPLIYLVRFIGALLIAPFQFLARFETLYIYLGIGAIIGCVLGVLLSLVSGSLQGPLGLNAPPKGRSVKEYRQDKKRQKAKATAMPVSHGYVSPSQLSLSDEPSRGTSRKKRVQGATIPSIDPRFD